MKKMSEVLSKSNRKVFVNLICAIASMAVFNAVLQFFVYPCIEKTVGEEKYGKILFFITLGIICSLSIGGATSTAFLKSRQRYIPQASDFFSIVLIMSAFACIVSMILSYRYSQNAVELIFVAILVFLYIMYDYSFVDFLQTNDYPRYLLYSLIISAGFVISVPLIFRTKKWEFIIIGFVLGIIYVALRKNIYVNPFKHSNNYKDSFKASVTLSGSYLLNYATQNLDRIILLYLINGTAVSYYYVASLFSKTLSMLTGPTNKLIISYLTNSKKELSRKVFLIINFFIVLGGIVFYAFCVFLSPILLDLPFLYPNLVERIVVYIPLASLSQILIICSSIVVALDLVVAPEKTQMLIQVIYAVSFLVLAIVLTNKNQINGFIIASCAAGILRYIVSIIIGVMFTKKEGEIKNEYNT
ncbi:MAG: hypothetical protein IJ872_05055 [Eubacterium sp.]|nr:hypothetical protein [Eubacterium sp.]